VKTDVVVDVGNTRIKWGRCEAGMVAGVAALPPEDPAAWERQLLDWGPSPPRTWTVTGVHPARRDRLAGWLRQRGERVHVLDFARLLPLTVELEHPDRVGIDRLLNAVAGNARRRPGVAAVIVDAGSAVTVDHVDAEGAFRGGAILPGLRLMTRALHDYTALLPLVEIREPPPKVGASTTAAVQAGVFWSLLGGIVVLAGANIPPSGELDLFFTGGDAALLAAQMPVAVQVWPEMTLEGVRLEAAALPE
jgi:type III pantothenate kinase